jgi:hypothetical protein
MSLGPSHRHYSSATQRAPLGSDHRLSVEVAAMQDSTEAEPLVVRVDVELYLAS